MPGHWSGSVVIGALALGALIAAVRAGSKREWAQLACWSCAAVGFGHLSAVNAGVTSGAWLSSLFILAFLVLWRVGQRTNES